LTRARQRRYLYDLRGNMKITEWISENTSSLKGKKIAVTGSTGGIGRELCAHLASLGASLILLDRNEARSKAHKESILSRFADAEVECVHLDLEDLDSVDRATEILNEIKIDVFINNAGAYNIPRHICESGYDNVFQINFVSPYYMIRKLMPMLRESKGRIVAVGSIAHNCSKIDKNDIDFKKRSSSMKVYGNAKRFLIFSLYELFKGETDVKLSVAHPGITLTGITANYPKPIRMLVEPIMKLVFMHPGKASLSVLNGVFKDVEYGHWIGPSVLDIWGSPKVRSLNSCKTEEIERIGELAKCVYFHCESSIMAK